MQKISILLSSICCSVLFAQTQENSEVQSQVMESSTTTTISKEQKEATIDSLYKDIFKKASVKGFAFGRVHSIHGPRGEGFSQQYRIKLDVTTGKIYGFSLTGGIFFSQGSSAIDAGRTTDGDVQGARGTAYNDNFADRFNVGTIYMSKEFNVEKAKFNVKIDAGKMNIASPLNDKNLDLGLGGALNIKHTTNNAEFKYYAAFFDSWNTDHANYNIRRRGLNGTTNINGIPPLFTNATLVDQEAAAVGIGNNLTIFHFNTKLFKNLSINALYANIYGLFDYMAFGDIGYKLNITKNQNITFLTQIAAAGMSDNPHIDIGHKGNAVNNNFGYEFANLSAKHRGVYNIQVKYKVGGFSTKLGYLGSFGDGYGVLLAHKSGIDTAGKVWNGNFTATYEGLGFLGSGSFRGTSLSVAYLAMKYTFTIPLAIGLDVSYLFGNNNFPLLDAAWANVQTHSLAAGSGGSLVGGKTTFVNANFFEITPSISYTFFKHFEISFFTAVFVGDLEFIKTRTELKWTF